VRGGIRDFSGTIRQTGHAQIQLTYRNQVAIKFSI
jgi:hypothetical protein